MAGPSAAAFSSRSDSSSRVPILMELLPSAGGADEEEPPALASAATGCATYAATAANLPCSRTLVFASSSDAVAFTLVRKRMSRGTPSLRPALIRPSFTVHCTSSTSKPLREPLLAWASSCLPRQAACLGKHRASLPRQVLAWASAGQAGLG